RDETFFRVRFNGTLQGIVKWNKNRDVALADLLSDDLLSFDYNTNGNLARIQDGQGWAATLERNGQDQIVASRSTDSAPETFHLNQWDELEEKTYGGGVLIVTSPRREFSGNPVEEVVSERSQGELAARLQQTFFEYEDGEGGRPIGRSFHTQCLT